MSKINKQIADAGRKLTLKELQSIAKSTGYTPESIVRRAEKANVRIGSGARTFAQTGGVQEEKKEPPSFDGDPTAKAIGQMGEIFQTLQTGQENLANIQGQWAQNATVSSAGIRADADKEVAKAYADAQKYASSLGLEGVKYGADKEAEWRQAVANIEVKGKLDLQPIINAGLERVAGIEAQASRDVAETTGKYSLESMKQRTAADTSIGKMQLAGSMYGLLGSVFG
jgi:hypothetical protein